MARKKTTDLKGDLPDALPAENGAATATTEAPEAAPPVPQNGNGHPINRPPRQPDVSWRLSSDRTTSIEASAWVNEYTSQQGETYEQVTFTVQRSYRDQNNVWARGGSWRTHDVPVLLFLLQKAHHWALERRTTDSTCPL